MGREFRLIKPGKRGFCEILLRNIEDFKRLGYDKDAEYLSCLLYTSPSPRDLSTSRMPSSA